MRKAFYWLAGVLALSMVLAVIAAVGWRSSAPTMTSAPPTPESTRFLPPPTEPVPVVASPSFSPGEVAGTTPIPIPAPTVAVSPSVTPFSVSDTPGDSTPRTAGSPPDRTWTTRATPHYYHRNPSPHYYSTESPTPGGTNVAVASPTPTATLSATPSLAPTATPVPSSSSAAALKSYVCPTCGELITYKADKTGVTMLRCWRCASVFYADDRMMPPDPADVPQASAPPSATPMASASATPADPLAAVDAALEKMNWGQMAFDVPERLRKDQTALIHLLVSPTATVEQLTVTIREQATEPVKIEPARIQISDLMEAKLVGAAFDIQPITPGEPQMISRSQPTEWKWEIHPRQTGPQSLHLTLNAIVRYDGEKHARAVRSFDRVIEVEVAAASSFYERAGRWLLPAVGSVALVVLGGMAFLFRRRRRPVAPPAVFASSVRLPGGEENDLFVSYSRRDQEQALALVGRLQAVGYKVWIDQRGIDGATLWAQEISEAIRCSRVCVLFASAASFGSVNVARELSLVCDEGKPILPLLLEPAEIPSALRFQLAGIQHIELFRGEAEENFQKVLRSLDRLGVARPAAAETR